MLQILPCPQGTYSSLSGMSSCTPCAAGTFMPTTGSSVCFTTPAGFYSLAGATMYTACASGSSSNVAGASACSACTGQFIQTTGVCQGAPNGATQSLGSFTVLCYNNMIVLAKMDGTNAASTWQYYGASWLAVSPSFDFNSNYKFDNTEARYPAYSQLGSLFS